jgi:hypothetical protein
MRGEATYEHGGDGSIATEMAVDHLSESEVERLFPNLAA